MILVNKKIRRTWHTSYFYCKLGLLRKQPAYCELPLPINARNNLYLGRHPVNWPIFVISLSDDTSRRKLISENLIGLGVEFEIIEAINGLKGLPVQYEHFIDRAATLRGFGRKMTDGEYACALSHQKAYGIILERDLPGAIILEDDTIPAPEFKRFIETKAYNAGDLIQLDYANTYVKIFRKNPLFDAVCLRPLYCNSCRTAGYSISRRGAEYLHENSFPITAPADWPCDITKIDTQVVVPPLTRHPVNTIEQSSLKLERYAYQLEGRKKRARDWKRFSLSNFWRWLRRRLLSVKIA